MESDSSHGRRLSDEVPEHFSRHSGGRGVAERGTIRWGRSTHWVSESLPIEVGTESRGYRDGSFCIRVVPARAGLQANSTGGWSWETSRELRLS